MDICEAMDYVDKRGAMDKSRGRNTSSGLSYSGLAALRLSVPRLIHRSSDTSKRVYEERLSTKSTANYYALMKNNNVVTILRAMVIAVVEPDQSV